MKFWAKAASQKAELYIYDAIGQDYFGDGISAKSVNDALKEFKPGVPLDVYGNSPGGNVFDGVAIYNQLVRWGGKKTVHIDGLAASIASVIAMAGDESRASPTVVDYMFTAPLSGVSASVATVTGVVGNDDALRAPAVKMRFDPTTAPGLFAG